MYVSALGSRRMEPQAYPELFEKCEAAGQQHILDDWDSLNLSQQQQLAAEIQARLSATQQYTVPECCLSGLASTTASVDPIT